MASVTGLEYKGIKFDVEFNYEEEQIQTLEQEGYNEHITEIVAFEYNGVCFLDFLTSEDVEKVKILIFETK